MIIKFDHGGNDREWDTTLSSFWDFYLFELIFLLTY